MAKVLFKFGTRADYNALTTKQSNALYFLTDTGELYRGEVPFGQSKVYSGTRLANELDNVAILRILNSTIPVVGDIVVIQNANNSSDAFVYSQQSTWVKIGNSLTDTILDRVSLLESDVADLDELLNGTDDGNDHIPGLIDRVDDLETELTNLSAAAAGAFHFKGSVADLDALEAIVNPAEGDVYQVGSKEYAWNGTDWIELGSNIDLSNYVTTTDLEDAVADLETLINNIPIFDGTEAGLVPVPSSNLTTEEKARYYLNALGQWVENNAANTNTIEVDGVEYTIAQYVNYVVENAALEWENIINE